jgi:hypothetical protein
VWTETSRACGAVCVPSGALFFVRVNQVLVRLWTLPSQSLTGCLRMPLRRHEAFRGVKVRCVRVSGRDGPVVC